MLREKRLAKGFTLEKVEQATKIRRKFLDAIERDDYKVLPSSAYAKGFIKNYGDMLGMNSSDLIAFFRRQTIEGLKTSPFPRQVTDPMQRSLFELTPGKFVAFLVLGLFGMLVLYFGLQYQKLSQPPILVVEKPTDALEVKGRRTEVEGVTDGDATVTVNGVTVIVRSDGKFFDQVAIEPGVNIIEVVATSRYGKTVSIERKVINIGE